MRVLVIDDESSLSSRLSEQLGKLNPSVDTVVAASRSSGIEAILSDEFDFIICDLRIPPHDGGVDVDEEHGLAVHSVAKANCPGTPCLFYTGFATSRNVSDHLSSGGTYDILGTGEPYNMTQLLTKDESLRCIERLGGFNSELTTLNTIKIDSSGTRRKLDQMEKRALRLLARPLGGTSIEVSALSGLSGAQTLRASVRNDKGHEVASHFVKIDDRAKLKRERENYQKYVSPLLRIGHFPAVGRDIIAGIGKREAIFYQFAEEYTQSLFDVLGVSDSDATDVVKVLRTILNPWVTQCEKRLLRVRDMREKRIDESKLRPFVGALGPIETFEEVEQEMKISCQHGDLHGFNVLCNSSGKAIVIDFGNVGNAPACTDPIVLELSVLFHKDSPFRNKPWPTNSQTEAWFDLDEYVRDCPFPRFIRKCREWAIEAGGPTGLPVVVYTEAVRQLKYEDTNHELALGIARAAIREIT